jgi:hypothetical protein
LSTEVVGVVKGSLAAAAALVAVAVAAGFLSEFCAPAALVALSRLPARPLRDLPIPLAGAVVVAARDAPSPYSTIVCATAVPAVASHSENETEKHAINRVILRSQATSLARLRAHVTLAKVN